MVIFFQRCDGNVFSSGHHCQRWFFNGFATPWPSPLNVFLQIDHWHRWFFNGFTQIQVRWLAMVLVMKGPEKKRKCNISHFTTNLRNLQNTLHAPFHPSHFSIIVLICTQHLEFMNWMKILPSWVLNTIRDSKLVVVVFGLSKPVFSTIEHFQWFSQAPSPLNGMVRGNHWTRWFYNGFGSANHW